jgi:predicted  nucleic acid-binding Zn-ribbon protein
MVPVIEQLLQIQDKDVRIANLKKQIDTVPREKAKLQEEIVAAEKLMDGAKATLLDLEKKLKSNELDIATQKQKKQELLGKSHLIKKNDEYKAMLSEAAQFDAKVQILEDQQIQLWEQVEAAKVSRAAAQKEVDVVRARLNASISDLDVREKNCREQIAKVEQERDALHQGIPEDLLRLYQRIIRRGAAPGSTRKGLAPLVDQNCGACNLKVTPQVRHLVLKHEITCCENCGVILYRAD